MKNLYNLLFSPFGKEWCVFFQILMYLAFFIVIITFFGIIYDMFFNKKSKKNYLMYILALGQVILYYFVYRLFYSMCIN